MLTEDKLAILRESIAAAVGAGECRYQIDNKPACIVGQIAVREGVSVDELKWWDLCGDNADSVGINNLLERENAEAQRIADIYGAELLLKLQMCWDLTIDTYAADDVYANSAASVGPTTGTTVLDTEFTVLDEKQIRQNMLMIVNQHIREHAVQ